MWSAILEDMGGYRCTFDRITNLVSRTRKSGKIWLLFFLLPNTHFISEWKIHKRAALNYDCK